MKFACLNGHEFMGWMPDGLSIDMEGYFCPACLGAVVGHENMIDSRFLSPVQDSVPAAQEGAK